MSYNDKEQKTKISTKNNNWNNNGFKSQLNFVKDKDDDYSPKVYAKKPKVKNKFYNIEMSEQFLAKEQGRRKRENDKKHKRLD